MRQIIRDRYLKIIGSIKKPSAGIHIINSHFISNEALDIDKHKIVFRKYVENLLTKCTLLKFEDAVGMIVQGKYVNRPHIAFSFDDGFEECYSIVAPILEEFCCNAAFFINSNFIDSDKNYCVQFEKRVNCYNKKPMNWENVLELSSRGHIIGSHTKDHLNLSEISKKQIISQIQDDKYVLESKLKYECEYFAWPFGQRHHFTEKALKIALENFKYIFSGSNYKNYFSYFGNAINRRHIEPYWDIRHINYFLSANKNYNFPNT